MRIYIFNTLFTLQVSIIFFKKIYQKCLKKPENMFHVAFYKCIYDFYHFFPVKTLEKAKSTGQFAVSGSMNSRGAALGFDVSGSDSEETNGIVPVAKKIKLSVE